MARETVLKWQSDLIKKCWTFPSKKSKVGRPPFEGWVKNLILEMKTKNLFCSANGFRENY